jgi:hypothetical protein
MKDLQKTYLYFLQREKERPLKNPSPWEVRAEETIEKWNRVYDAYQGPSHHYLLDARNDPKFQAECDQNRHNRKTLARRKLAILVPR